jgi:hypothetical protein
MEPVFMMLGHAGGLAAQMAEKAGVRAQEVDVKTLQAKLTADGVPLKAPFRPVVAIRLKSTPPLRPGVPVQFEVVKEHVRAPLTMLAWNFDGSGEVQASGESVSHTFPQPGPATVMLLAQDADKLVALPATLDVRIGDEPALDREVPYSEAKLTGRWSRARGPEIEYRGRVGLADEGKRDGAARAEFTATLPRTGRYRVALAFPSGGNRATNVPVTIAHAGGTAKVRVNERQKATPFAFTPIGEFRFNAGEPATVTITNEAVDGTVLIDSVRWIWLGE